MKGLLDELRALADEERRAEDRRKAAIQEANDRHAQAMEDAYSEYLGSGQEERNRQIGALMLQAVDEGVRAADVGQALGISTRRAQRQLRYFREMSPEVRAEYGAPPSPDQLRSRLHAVTDYSPLEET